MSKQPESKSPYPAKPFTMLDLIDCLKGTAIIAEKVYFQSGNNNAKLCIKTINLLIDAMQKGKTITIISQKTDNN